MGNQSVFVIIQLIENNPIIEIIQTILNNTILIQMYVKSTYLKRQIQATRKQLWKSPSDAFRAIQSLKFEKKTLFILRSRAHTWGHAPKNITNEPPLESIECYADRNWGWKSHCKRINFLLPPEDGKRCSGDDPWTYPWSFMLLWLYFSVNYNGKNVTRIFRSF